MHSSQILGVIFTGVVLASAITIPSNASNLSKRRVPQEHSHEAILASVRDSLALDNPDGFVDPVFGLLGAAAATGGAKGADPDCLQQLIADQAFTNARNAGDIQAMTDALIYRTLDRNTAKSGLASVPCTSVTTVNPEVAALEQHQDAAAPGAIALNKQITLDLAVQIDSFGGDPLEALKSGTFAPGRLDDSTARGGSCNRPDDRLGCIFTENLLVPDVTAEEIKAAVNPAPVPDSETPDAGEGTSPVVNETNLECSATVTVTVTADSKPTASESAPESVATAPPVEQEGGEGILGGKGGVASGGITSIAQASQLGVSSNIGLGACSNIALAFGAKLEGRKETSFIPANLEQFPHGSAQNPNIITNFMCDNLVNRCGLKRGDPGHALCEEARDAIADLPRNGAAADAFNGFFGISTNFAPTPVVNSQGNIVE